MQNFKSDTKRSNQELDFLLNAIDKLPADAAKVIRLHYIGQQSLSEIATILQRPINAINILHVEGIYLLRKQVQEKIERN